jgi:hypothetical protein
VKKREKGRKKKRKKVIFIRGENWSKGKTRRKKIVSEKRQIKSHKVNPKDCSM